MKTRERYLTFGVGFFIGTLILLFLSFAKKHAKLTQEVLDKDKGYYKEQGILPGHDFKAQRPLIASNRTLYVQEYPPIDSENNIFLRVSICEGIKEEPYWRFEERIWKDPNNPSRERLVSRQKMMGNQILVRLKERNETNLKELEAYIEKLDMKLAHEGNGPNLFKIQLPNAQPETLTSSIEYLLKNKTLVETALPIFLYNQSPLN